MTDFLEYFKNKRNLSNLILLLILVIGLPIGIGLVRQQQILRSRAAVDPIVFLAGQCVENRNGKLVATCENVAIQLTSPLGPPATGSGTLDPCPTEDGGLVKDGDKKNKKEEKKNKDKGKDESGSIFGLEVFAQDKKADKKAEKEDKKDKDKEDKEEKKGKNKNGQGKIPCPTEDPLDQPVSSNNPVSTTPNPSSDSVCSQELFPGNCTPAPSVVCDPETKDEVKIKATWVKGKVKKECKNGQQEVEYSCSGTDNKGKQKTQKRDIKEACTGATNIYSPNLLEKLASLVPFTIDLNPKEAFAGHAQGDCVNNNSCNNCEEDGSCSSVTGEYCDTNLGKICEDLKGGGHNCTDRACGSGGSGGTCNIGLQEPGLSSSCVSHMKSSRYGDLVESIRRQDRSKFEPCLDTQVLNYWCNGISPSDCNLKKQEGGAACGTSGGSCSIGFQDPTLTDPQVSCMSGSRYGNLVGSIKDLDSKFNSCSNKQILNYWCNGGVSDDAKNRDCPIKKTECAAGASPSTGNGGGKDDDDNGGGGSGGGGGGGKNKDKKKGASPSPSSTATPVGNTVSFKYAENPADLALSPAFPYDTEPKIINYTFKSAAPGVKSIFVEFMDKTGRKEQRTASIELVAPSPVIASAKCSLSSFGKGINIELSGEKFGVDKGVLVIREIGGDIPGNVLDWKDTSVSSAFDIPYDLEIEGVDLVFLLTRKDGVSLEGNCSVGETTSLALGAKLFCRAPSNLTQKDVELDVLENTPNSKIHEELVDIGKNGLIDNLEVRFVEGKNYQVSIKAPKSLRRNSKPFSAKEGTIQLLFERNDETGINNNFLPIGDIFPINEGDGTINTSDAVELFKQWGQPAKTSTTLRPGDFNQDGKVNSIDWACMRYDFNEREDPKLESISTQASGTTLE